MNTDSVSVVAMLPFWRYAVGPTSMNSPAIPFYTRKEADFFFEEIKKEIPFAGAILYKRKGWSCIETIEEYTPQSDSFDNIKLAIS